MVFRADCSRQTQLCDKQIVSLQEKHCSLCHLFSQESRQQYPAFACPGGHRQAHCHSVCLTFHLARGNRTPVLSCVCEDNRPPAFSCCFRVRDGSGVQKFQSRCGRVNTSPSVSGVFGLPSDTACPVLSSALMKLNNILD